MKVPISKTSPTELSAVRIRAEAGRPLYRQIYDAIRGDILGGSLSGGDRLTATRTMAADLGVSRNTVLEAIEQLVAEGYLTSRVGSGTFVASDLPDQLLSVGSTPEPLAPSPAPQLSKRGAAYAGWAERGRGARETPFQLGRPAVDRFPWQLWSRLSAQRARSLSPEWLDYGESAGLGSLRKQLARRLRETRGLECSPDQIIIVRGAQQGLDIAARILLEPGDEAWMEDPGYPAARVILQAAGAREVPVPVDSQGIDVAEGIRRAPDARLVYVTPSHQFPLGSTLSLARRLQLLHWARARDSWIIEDDYDSEYRFQGRPLASLAGLDGCRHVIYLGTLSKVLFPSLRLGYMVVPTEHIDAFVGARYVTDRHTSQLEQAIVADFFREGHFARHVRKMKTLYARRQEALFQAAGKHLSSLLELELSETGLHSVGWLRGTIDDAAVARAAKKEDVSVSALSAYCHEQRLRPALLLGYAGFPTREIEPAVRRLAVAIERARGG